MHLLKTDEHKEDYHIREPNDENFLFEAKGKKYVYVGDEVMSFKTNDELYDYSLDFGFNVTKFPFAYGEENIHFMLHQKYNSIHE